MHTLVVANAVVTPQHTHVSCVVSMCVIVVHVCAYILESHETPYYLNVQYIKSIYSCSNQCCAAHGALQALPQGHPIMTDVQSDINARDHHAMVSKEQLQAQGLRFKALDLSGHDALVVRSRSWVMEVDKHTGVLGVC